MIVEGQSLLDISIQEFGNVEALMDIALLNNVSLTELLIPGQTLETPNLESLTPEVQRYFKTKNYKPATGLEAIDYVLTLFESGLFTQGLFQ